jgi:hypothetical protein
MVDQKNAVLTEEQLMKLIKKSRKLSKYKLVLHNTDRYGIDIEATASGYEEFAIEVESTQGTKWPKTAPWPTNWRKFSVPARKKKFFERHPMSLFVKVNADMTRAAVIPMSYVCSSDLEGYANENDGHFTCNEFYVIFDPDHPALCFCKIEDLASVIDEHFQYMIKLKRANAKYTDKRPEFATKNKEN